MQLVQFKVSNQLVAFPVAAVREVTICAHAARVFRAPDHLLGLADVRGEAVPVFDLAALLGLPRERASAGQVVIVEVGAYRAGFLAQPPVDMAEVDDAGHAPPAAEGAAALTAVERVVEVDSRSVLVLDPAKLFDLPALRRLRE